MLKLVASQISKEAKRSNFSSLLVCDFVAPAKALVDISREQFLRNFLNFSMQLKIKKEN